MGKPHTDHWEWPFDGIRPPRDQRDWRQHGSVGAGLLDGPDWLRAVHKGNVYCERPGWNYADRRSSVGRTLPHRGVDGSQLDEGLIQAMTANFGGAGFVPLSGLLDLTQFGIDSILPPALQAEI